MSNTTKEWWNAFSKDYQKQSTIHTKAAHYGAFAPDENELRLLGNVRGKKILEIGCGGGQCSIAFAKQGAKCTGVDFSREQLKYAQALAQKEKVKPPFVEGNIQTLRGIKSHYYDIVFSAHTIQYVSDLNKCFKNINRVLKKNGVFVFSLGHPFYSILSHKQIGKIKRSYHFNEKGATSSKWANGKEYHVPISRRKVSDIFDSLTKTGFEVTRIIEPLKLKEQTAWTKGMWKEYYPKRLVKLMSPTIIFMARKP